jgi:hypothetical protein
MSMWFLLALPALWSSADDASADGAESLLRWAMPGTSLQSGASGEITIMATNVGGGVPVTIVDNVVRVTFGSEETADNATALADRCEHVRAPLEWFNWTGALHRADEREVGDCEFHLTPNHADAATLRALPLMAQLTFPVAATPGSAMIRIDWTEESKGRAPTQHVVKLG